MELVNTGFVVVETEFGEDFAEFDVVVLEFHAGPVEDSKGVTDKWERIGGVCLGELVGR